MISYFLWANIYALLFWILYHFTIRDFKSHSWSRFYLISSALSCLCLPLIKLDFLNIFAAESIQDLQAINLPEVLLKPTEAGNAIFHLKYPVLGLAYSVLVALLILQFVYRCFALKKFLSKLTLIKQGKFQIGINTGYGPASFGRVIIFPGQEIDEHILQHEKAHLLLKHHYDKIILQIVRCFCFPVLAFHLIYKELMMVQEFEADEYAAKNKEHYSKTLLEAHFNNKNLYLLQNFFHHPLKRRIMMLYKNKQQNNGRKALVVGLSIIFSTAIILFQSNTKLVAQPQQKEEKIYTELEAMPEFDGGMEGLMKYLSENIHYPEEAKKQNIHGRVMLQFVVAKDGTIKDVIIKRNLGAGCGEEAKRVIEAMPKWKPGTENGEPVNVYYTLPVTFALDSTQIPKVEYVK